MEGIYFVKISTLRTLFLSIIAKTCNKIAIYKLSSLDTACVGKSYISRMLDMWWFDKEFLVLIRRHEDSVVIDRQWSRWFFWQSECAIKLIQPFYVEECDLVDAVKY